MLWGLGVVLSTIVSSIFFLWSDNGIKKCIDPSQRRTEQSTRAKRTDEVNPPIGTKPTFAKL
jgi:hypothetical protein